ncbi:hypothetical protein HPB47_013453 [Ixodes persulcatus]|uniref:Uncharacterized protein n=1 Tax=Ixodes persulcatus TaxID=34615 RepID=A0AC60R0Z9_IXOPE|nr:hypothetical protein HPB47_013453 [Ixodes persulcatus]
MSVSPLSQLEVRCVLHWFSLWGPPEKEAFLSTLLARVAPSRDPQGKPLLTCPLRCSMQRARLGRDLSLELSLLSLQGSLSSPGSPQVLRCQLSLFEVYFSSWDAEGQRTFVRLLAQKDPSFVRRFLISLEQREPLLAATLAPL